MPITSESQRNQVVMLLALNMVFIVGYAMFVLLEVATPSPFLISVIVAGLGFNVVELWLSRPYDPAQAVKPKVREVRRTVTREPSTSDLMLGRTTAAPGVRRASSGRHPLSERLAELGEPASRIEPKVVPVELSGSEPGTGGSLVQTDPLFEEVQSSLVDREIFPVEERVSTLESTGYETPVAEVAPVLPAGETTELIGELVEELPHSAHSALAVDFVEAEIEVPVEISHVAELADIVDTVEADAEAAATMDALAELALPQAVIAADTSLETAMESSSQISEEVAAADPSIVVSEASAREVEVVSAASQVVDVVVDVLPASDSVIATMGSDILMVVDQPEPAVVEVTEAEALITVGESAETGPATVLSVTGDSMAAEVAEHIGTGETGLLEASAPASQGDTSAETVAATAATANVPGANVPGIEGLAADLMGDVETETAHADQRSAENETAESVADARPHAAAVSAASAVASSGTNAATAPDVPAIEERTHIGGRLTDPVDIVIASLRTDPVRKPAATGRRRAEVAAPSIPVPPRASTGLRASSETLAMLRNQLGVGQTPSVEPAPAARTSADAGQPQSGKGSSEDSGSAARRGAPAPRSAGKHQTAQSGDTARDRVMFVWQGRHFLAPMEGRHPLRVAQSLYDFMVEEALERG